MTPQIAVLITSYNRRAHTLNCLTSLAKQSGLDAQFSLKPVLVDATSPDGTAAEVRRLHPEVSVVTVPSSYYWGDSMRRASASPEAGAADYVLWLNDDVVLDVHAIEALLEASRDQPAQGIVVGQLRGSHGEPTYGGLRQGRHPLDFQAIGIQPTVTSVDTFNGNVVLMPVAVARPLGGVDARFPHAMGDIDFGLRARRAGVPIQQAPGSLGVCKRNPSMSQRGRAARLRAVTSIKVLPPRPWSKFCLRHAGAAAPAYIIKPYLAALLGRGE